MSLRRATWLLHNTLIAPIVIVRLPLFLIATVGEWAAAALNVMPGLRRYDGWSGWPTTKDQGDKR